MSLKFLSPDISLSMMALSLASSIANQIVAFMIARD